MLIDILASVLIVYFHIYSVKKRLIYDISKSLQPADLKVIIGIYLFSDNACKYFELSVEFQAHSSDESSQFEISFRLIRLKLFSNEL